MNKSDSERGIFVRIVKKRVPKETSSDMDETQPTKLGVGVDGGFASPEDNCVEIFHCCIGQGRKGIL